MIERPLQGELQLVNLERLRHITVRAHLHCLDRGIDRRKSCDQNHMGLAMMLAHMPQHIEAAHRLHLDVGDYDLGLD